MFWMVRLEAIWYADVVEGGGVEKVLSVAGVIRTYVRGGLAE